MILSVFLGIGTVVLIISGVRVVRPTEKGVVERFGKFKRIAHSGFNWIIPFVDQMHRIIITEERVDIPPQEVITKDMLNTTVDAVIYYKVHDPIKALYNVSDYNSSIVSLCRTTLRAIIGKMSLQDANQKRNEINEMIEAEISKQIELPGEKNHGWGIDIQRVEIQELTPPEDVQAAMNNVVKAENEKTAAIDLANAAETRADGERRSAIKKAEGVRQANILKAHGKAQAIKLVNEAANKYFIGNAQLLRRLETVEKALTNNAKIVVPSDQDLVNVIGDMAGVLPLTPGKNK